MTFSSLIADMAEAQYAPFEVHSPNGISSTHNPEIAWQEYAVETSYFPDATVSLRRRNRVIREHRPPYDPDSPCDPSYWRWVEKVRAR